MRRHLLASVCLPAAALAALPLQAETLVEAKRTDATRTSTIKSGAADDLRITSAGTINPASGTAVTIDSANKVTNEGTIQITNADGAIGVLADAGASGGIVNTGKIILDETYEPTDTDKDGDLDGPLASGTNRTGIRTAGAYTGPITNSGTITIEGNDSAAIWLGGPLTGNLTQDGAISVIGDRSVGVRIDSVAGNVRLAGTINAQGEGAGAARIDGNIAGALVVQGSLASTGYRTVTVPSDTSKLDADDLLQGGPTLAVAGDVSGGIIFAVPPKDTSPTDNDEDKDGIDDSKEGSASVTSYGAAPAVQIGAASRDIAIGAVAGTGTGFGLIVDGAISGQGLYSGVDATALSVGGLGGAVTIAGGIGVAGTINATSNGGNATAIRIGGGATTPEIRVSGSVSATGGSAATTRTAAILIDTGGTVATIRNSGAIKATASGADGNAGAILDRSGNVRLIENSGAISATGALATSDRNVAIDLSANTSGVTVRQTAVAAGIAAPSIVGDIRLGSGDDVLDVADGSVKGNVRFGAGTNRFALSGDAVFNGTASFGAGNDSLTLAGTSVFTGTADFGGGADTLTIGSTARFSGTLLNAQGLAVAVNGGTLEAGRGTAIGSLAIGNGGTLAVTLDNSSGGPASVILSNIVQVSGDASFAQGSKVSVKLASVANAEGRYTILRAGTLTGASNLTATTALLPYMFKGSLATVGTTDLAVDIVRKSSGELGLNRSQASIYDAAYQALGQDQKLGASFLNITEGDTFRKSLRQMLPDHAGGTFALASLGSRAMGRLLADPRGPFKDEGRWGYWISQIALSSSKSVDDTAGYSIDGWGLSSGGEYKTGFGNFGLSVGYIAGRDNDRGTDNDVHSNQWELATYWRGHWDGLRLYARASAARINFSSTRRFSGNTGTEGVTRATKGKWDGDMVSAAGGASYEVALGSFSFRPIAAVDYYRLKEDGHSETGGGSAFDLIAASRTSDELAVTGSVAAGLDFGGTDQDSGWLRIEVEGGRRQLVGGALGATTAHFAGGRDFTLLPEDRTSGWVGKLRATGGNSVFRIGSEFNAEQQQGRAALSLRANLQFDL
ncbi:autotransporter domain-containing protein [Sphingomonas sp. AP4-R1]|uniref:autotransporter outer membrane beta-barrel domain-containing protein n=1 Tax=Sphingomonas sp. AP4-R1 TaxID=2735134 RepID=UPI0014938494|nr:autotransporter outer membrane beta-barrel domain-containing protein [Sphingomonas sp. AP4-R1]QJU58555.1 autotransporter domain-containing protein [Sphingomonas sp. AP4-R1]